MRRGVDIERALEGLELGLEGAGQGDSVLEQMREQSHPPHGCHLSRQGCKRGAGAAQAGGMHPQSTHPHLQGPIALSPWGGTLLPPLLAATLLVVRGLGCPQKPPWPPHSAAGSLAPACPCCRARDELFTLVGAQRS